MIRKIVLLSGFIACTSASAVPVKAIRESWGKAGVTLDQYRADALTCNREGHDLDISNTDEAKAFVTASKQLDSMQGATVYQVPPPNGDPTAPIIDFASQQKHVIESINPEAKMRRIGRTLQSAVDQCLIARGYHKFRLTAAQTKKLGKLKIGSDERRQYLYSLARDPQILASQAEDQAPSPAMR